MICKKCGYNIIPSKKFCPNCGNSTKLTFMNIFIDVLLTVCIMFLLGKLLQNTFLPWLFASITAIFILLNVISYSNNYNQKFLSKPVFISLFVSAIIWGIFYFFTIFLALRGYMDLLFPRYMIFNTIVIFMACLKKYEIKNFVILNYKLIKDKITKSH